MVMLRILILEDDHTLRSIFVELLSARGHTVVSAADGDTALALLREGATDLLITDILLPGKDGVEVITAVRREFHELRIIAISGAPSGGKYLCQAGEVGANALLPKPFLPSALFHVIDTIMPSEVNRSALNNGH